jgi:DNA-binding beta-propeller fold protein YncE
MEEGMRSTSAARCDRPAKQFTVGMESLESRTFFSGGPLANGPFLPNLATNTPVVTPTIPGNGDVNPYGVAIVPQNVPHGGKLHAGDVLVSNFNASSNVQGTGTTIVDISPSGKQSVFFQGPKGLGLTTALGILPDGFVIVGNLPSKQDGTANGPGSLIILDKNGNVVRTLTDSKLLDGPWDLTVESDGIFAQVFVSNVLSGTVTRLDLLVNPFPFDTHNPIFLLSKTQIASGYISRPDSMAFEIGPTGLALDDKTDTLYVASTGDNAVFAISNAEIRFKDAGTGTMIFTDPHLRGPLGLAFAPNGNLLAANGDAINMDTTNTQNSEIVEFTKSGQFEDQFQVDPGLGGAFGLASQQVGDKLEFAAVDDVTNSLLVWTLDN